MPNLSALPSRRRVNRFRRRLCLGCGSGAGAEFCRGSNAQFSQVKSKAPPCLRKKRGDKSGAPSRISPQLQSRCDLSMRKAALLYNPESGGSKQKQRELQSALEILRAGRVEAKLFASDSREQATELVRQAMSAGCDTVFACGGDGTINNIAQVLAQTPGALGILPIGPGNARAHG